MAVRTTASISLSRRSGASRRVPAAWRRSSTELTVWGQREGGGETEDSRVWPEQPLSAELPKRLGDTRNQSPKPRHGPVSPSGGSTSQSSSCTYPFLGRRDFPIVEAVLVNLAW